MKRITILALFLASAAAAAGVDWSEKCAGEGGCMLITRHAFDHLVSEVVRLQRTIEAIRKEQCA